MKFRHNIDKVCNQTIQEHLIYGKSDIVPYV